MNHVSFTLFPYKFSHVNMIHANNYHKYIFTHKYIYTHKYIRMHICMMYKHIHTQMFVCVYGERERERARARVHVGAMFTYVHKMQIHNRIYTYVCMYMYVHMEIL